MMLSKAVLTLLVIAALLVDILAAPTSLRPRAKKTKSKSNQSSEELRQERINSTMKEWRKAAYKVKPEGEVTEGVIPGGLTEENIGQLTEKQIYDELDRHSRLRMQELQEARRQQALDQQLREVKAQAESPEQRQDRQNNFVLDRIYKGKSSQSQPPP